MALNSLGDKDWKPEHGGFIRKTSLTSVQTSGSLFKLLKVDTEIVAEDLTQTGHPPLIVREARDVYDSIKANMARVKEESAS